MAALGTHQAPRNEWLTIPNLLSLGRLIATPVLCWLIVDEARLAAALLFAAMGVSDYLDGQIARATGRVTELGIILDPTSDRIVVMAALVTILVTGGIPLWLGVPVLARDAILSVVFLVLARRGFGRPNVKMIGKTATFALLSALPAIVYGEGLRGPGLAVFALGGALYYIAALAYTKDIARWLKEQRA